jgi:hypothetical protein
MFPWGNQKLLKAACAMTLLTSGDTTFWFVWRYSKQTCHQPEYTVWMTKDICTCRGEVFRQVQKRECVYFLLQESNWTPCSSSFDFPKQELEKWDHWILLSRNLMNCPWERLDKVWGVFALVEEFFVICKTELGRQSLSTVDGHSHHKYVCVLSFAKENGIVMLCLPPHCAHRR